MNKKTKVIYCLARMYEYVKDICDICTERRNNYESIVTDTITKHAINMCLVQLGEHANRIRTEDNDYYRNSGLSLPQIKGMRDRITHAYGDIDYKIIKDVLQNGIPRLREMIEAQVHNDVLENPYMLFETEYDDYVGHSAPTPTPTEVADSSVKSSNPKHRDKGTR